MVKHFSYGKYVLLKQVEAFWKSGCFSAYRSGIQKRGFCVCDRRDDMYLICNRSTSLEDENDGVQLLLRMLVVLVQYLHKEIFLIIFYLNVHFSHQ